MFILHFLKRNKGVCIWGLASNIGYLLVTHPLLVVGFHITTWCQILVIYNRVFGKVRKTRHQKPWVWSKTGWDSKKKPVKKYISLQGGGIQTQKCTTFCANLKFSSCFDPVFFFFLSASPLLLHIFSLLLPVQLL